MELNIVYKSQKQQNFECQMLNINRSGFSWTHKIGNIGIYANHVFPYIYCFHPYLYHMLLVNVKLNVTGYKGIAF